jgi:hypothetical protein
MCHARIDQITDLSFSHQDPDVASSLGMWDEALPHAPCLWEWFEALEVGIAVPHAARSTGAAEAAA